MVDARLRSAVRTNRGGMVGHGRAWSAGLQGAWRGRHGVGSVAECDGLLLARCRPAAAAHRANKTELQREQRLEQQTGDDQATLRSVLSRAIARIERETAVHVYDSSCARVVRKRSMSGLSTLPCSDTFGDGWHGAYIDIAGAESILSGACSSFRSGRSTTVTFTVASPPSYPPAYPPSYLVPLGGGYCQDADGQSPWTTDQTCQLTLNDCRARCEAVACSCLSFSLSDTGCSTGSCIAYIGDAYATTGSATPTSYTSYRMQPGHAPSPLLPPRPPPFAPPQPPAPPPSLPPQCHEFESGTHNERARL